MIMCAKNKQKERESNNFIHWALEPTLSGKCY